MSIPLLEYAPVSQNHRVDNFEIPGEEYPRIYTTDRPLSASELDVSIAAAYRQIFNEQQMLERHRQKSLESQLRSGKITVKEFIRGLVLSDSFRRLVYESNNNYRLVEICIQRILGRNVYSDREKIAWSIVIATKGLQGFVSALLNSEEYATNFGDRTVPYQRRRILPQRSRGEVTFAHTARYGTDYRDKLPKPNMRSVWMFQQNADGLFAKDERFNWQAFVQRANWPVVAGLSLSLFVILFGMLAVAISNQ
ncbi:MAG: phycobilisome rod-core linker polypeptide [Microcoleus sp.]